MRQLGDTSLASAEATIASAATTDLGSRKARLVVITGTTTITSFGTAATREVLLRFAGALTLTHNATSLALPGGVNIVTATGDTAIATSDASGNWTVRNYTRASGKALTGPVASDITDASTSGRTVLTGTPQQGATALGLGTGNVPTFNAVVLTAAAGGYVEIGSSNGQANNETLQFRTSLSGTAGNKVVGTVVGAPDTGTGGRLVFSTLGTDGVTREAGRIDANQNVGIGTASPGTRLDVAGPIRPGTYTVATLPAGVAGAQVYASNGRKVGEAAGSGTGVIAYYSNGNWRRLSDDSQVAV